MVRGGRDRSRSPDRKRRRSRSRSKDRSRSSRHRRSRSRERRSRSRDRRERDRRSYSRDRDRRRGDSKEKRSSGKSRRRDKSRSRSRSTDRKKDDSGLAFDPANLDKEEEQKKLELEMQKRRERIERWRAERKKKEEEMKKDAPNATTTTDEATAKKWSLENDSEDEDKDKGETKEDQVEEETNGEAPPQEEKQEAKEEKKEEEEEEEEVDPLDEYMKGVQEEVRKTHKLDMKKPKTESGNKKGALVIVTGVAKSKVNKNKGELIEQNQDGLEYSSEEEIEDLKDTAASIVNKQKKELAKIDHNMVRYLPFRKNFYVEVPEIAKMTHEEVEAYKEELEGIRVKGKGCPKPIKTWAQCGVSTKELNILKKLGFEKPTPIQVQAIPAIMSGRDLIGIAKTGSGKTLAFLLPMFRHILDQPPLEELDGPIAIIMTPTRELCMQIGKDIKKFTKSLNLHAVCVYGGTGISEQIAELKRGAEIIVCTPGRMIDMLAANGGKVTNLRRVTYIVLDEADRMFDMGFEPQVMRIIDNVRPDRQTVMFSATFPRQMEALARRILQKPIEVQVGGRSVVCKDVEQHVVILEEDQKFLKLLELLGLYHEHGSIIVFVDKQENADILLKELMKAAYNCLSLHGGIDQFDRDSTIIDFKSGKVKLLIATSVAARGLDVKHLILVVNYDCPNHYEDYVHRCGRTGRAGNKGFAYTFITPEQSRYAGDIIRAFELASVPIPDPLRALWDSYKSKQEAEGKKVHSGGGFSGKGFKFDENEAAAVTERKKFQKAALGLADSDDEDLEHDIDQHIESMFATKRTVKEIKAPLGLINPAAMNTQTAMDKLELAKRLASRINFSKNISLDTKFATQQAAESILKGSSSSLPITAKTVAEQLAAKLNTKLNYQPKDDDERDDIDNEQTFRKYEEELEINDFPQQARWRVTSKEALAQISEYSEAGITVRGTYVPNGKNPPEGERKLYLAIESTSDIAVAKAKAEITRLIKEELLKLQTAGHHSFNKARYKVV
ncbi:probable ATP-dependent RNA helicase DDX46 isoform X1 [Tribolium castaneum]|uniref:Probable ATP-dependent RNA helicase DDX46 n=1 Tax=Tribolium castaneum TaxID=7070 RepID=D6WUR2_TRICA|nr:PREDICTED: probable ATP-dependent RNA helicase DDX46 [Tribolium castaneum]EFA07812.2 putative ATP-dependent RNA helicase DDX46-like Protein [Tribolium castaneum]|eukprot:XP_008197421.1 PREDICTED: probable ATP-dependent RNA helicase DDX46 [Tribolium castaneum]